MLAALAVSDLYVLAGSFLSGLFAVLSIALLVKYRGISQQANSSVELGKDLLDAMESRLRKQDERILDVMTRLDVIQARSGAQAAPPQQQVTPITAVTSEKVTEPTVEPHIPERAESQPDPTELAALKLLAERPHTSNEVNAVIGKSREHMSRLMKGLYSRGLVSRDDSKRPFVYQLTDEGRRYLSAS